MIWPYNGPLSQGNLLQARRESPSCFNMPTSAIKCLRFIEGSLEVKLPTIWTDEKHSQKEAEPGRNSDVEKVRMEKIRDG